MKLLLLASSIVFAVMFLSAFSATGHATAPVQPVTGTNARRGSAAPAELVGQMIAWKSNPRVADQLNPFRPRVVALGEEAVPALLERLADAPPLSDVVGALGAIGSRRAFPGLLAKYLVTPDDAIAISLGCTLSEIELMYLRDSNVLGSERSAAMLGVILGTPGRPVTNKSAVELWQAVSDQLPDVRRRCVERCHPMPG